MMAKSTSDPHVFVSYLRENLAEVEELCDELRRADVAVWLDRENIQPGERWQTSIRRAIEDGASFLACFSQAYGARGSSYMNVELTIAIDQLRARPTDRGWFIPVLLKGGSVPDRPIGGGETLRDIQWVDLAEDWRGGIRRLLDVVARAGSPRSTSAKAMAEAPHLVVVIADLDGIPKVIQRLGDESIQRLIDELNDLLLRAIDENRGRTVQLLGSGVVGAFDSAPDAIRCACLISSQIRSYSEERRGGELGVRIGLAAGPPVHQAGFPVGGAVSFASRLCSLADAGEILVSESVHELAGDGGFEIRERGMVAFKGLAERLRIYGIRP